MYYLFFDLETTGLITKRGAKYCQLKYMPRTISICWTLTDSKNNVIEHFYSIVKPVGFEIPEDSIKIHGVTNEIAKRDGKSFKKIVRKIQGIVNKYNENNLTLIAHNLSFDIEVLKADLLRNKQYQLIADLDKFRTICTKEDTIDYCKCEPFRWGSWKWPRLEELHQKCFNTGIENAHCAEDDVNALRKCFFHLLKQDNFENNWITGNKSKMRKYLER